MSRIGNKAIALPDGVKVQLQGPQVRVEGPKGRLQVTVLEGITVAEEGRKLVARRADDSINARTRHGTVRSLLASALTGVTQGFRKKLLIDGVGFKAALQGKKLTMSLGFTHPVIMDVPEGLTIKTPSPTEIEIEGIDKQLVGFFAARIRSCYEPEPYKGKGIRYEDERIRRKAGKSVTK